MLDLDGLLIDTEKFHYHAYRQMCAAEGETLPWNFSLYLQYAQSAKGGLEKALCSALPKLTKDKSWVDLYEVKQKYLDHILKSHQIECMPGAAQLLQWLARKKIAFCAVTNTRRHHVELLRQRCACLQLIPKWWAREDYDSAKPSPAGYLAAIESFGISAHQAYGFEDSPKGLRALLAAGASGALINGGDLAFSRQESFCNKRWKRYFSLEEWMAIHGEN